MMDEVELEHQRLNTKAFIDAKPVELVLTPVTAKVRTAGGGYSQSDGTPRASQTLRIIETSSRTSAPIIRTQDGRDRQVNFWLLGEYDAAMEIGDHWSSGGRDWVVEDVIRSNGYEVRGVVIERGA